LNLSVFVGLRYAGVGFPAGISRPGNRFLSFISLVSLLGMMLGVTALIVVVSVMNGFDSELKRRILGVIPHVVISGQVDPASIHDDQRIIASAPFISRSGLLLDGNSSQLVTLFGIDVMREQQMSIIPDHMIQGSMQDLGDAEHGVVIGRSLGYRLGVVPGDRLTLVIPEPSAGGSRFTPKIARLVLVGTFELDSELDYRLALLNISEMQRIVAAASVDTRLRLGNVFDAPQLSRLLARDGRIKTRNWTQQYGDFFETVRMEKIMMFVLLSLIVAIAAFNIISSLSMMVKDKQKDIAVLRTFGLSPAGVMQVFMIQGIVIGVAGILSGTLMGLALAYNITDVVGFFEELSGSRMLAGTYFDSVPSDVRYRDVLLIIVVAFLISILATLYPAWRAATLRPAEILRYE
jgi:lipoprotein-releasing system permease protein